MTGKSFSMDTPSQPRRREANRRVIVADHCMPSCVHGCCQRGFTGTDRAQERHCPASHVYNARVKYAKASLVKKHGHDHAFDMNFSCSRSGLPFRIEGWTDDIRIRLGAVRTQRIRGVGRIWVPRVGIGRRQMRSVRKAGHV
jgi:hypothetical protein